MGIKDCWLLPEGIEEVLPSEARRLERLRRNLLDLYDSWGYELVIPPFIEFLESLLTGTGNDLDLQTFKATDQLSGRLMGLRADMSPQVARIDAHQLKRRDIPTRLCYMGTVLLARGDGFGGSRSPFQVGAELYGHSGYESDLEVLSLMLETLALVNVANVYLDLGHVAIFRSLVRQAGLNPEQESTLFEALQRKAITEIQEQLMDFALPPSTADMFLALVEFNGGAEVLTLAQQALAKANDAIHRALESLQQIAAAVQYNRPGIPINFDLAELRGYHYHTGLVFAAYVPGQGQEVARGGRYDGIGHAFGHPRPATGFSADLKNLLTLTAAEDNQRPAIHAPQTNDLTLATLVSELRADGERVIGGLPGSDPLDLRDLGCDRRLVKQDELWMVVPLEEVAMIGESTDSE